MKRIGFYFMSLICMLFYALFSVHVAIAAELFFEFKADDGLNYLSPSNAHPGGGYFSRLGGIVSNPDGTGCSDPNSYRNTVISNDVSAQGSTPGKLYALKTPYNGACPNESFSRDTTIITVPNLHEGYVRWYQKWTGDWNSASVQQKFTKFYVPGGLEIAHFSFAAGAKNWRAYLPNIDGHFDKDGITRATGQIWVYASKTGQGSVYSGANRSYDDYNNGIGGTDGEFYFVTNKWYSLEIHWKVNTDGATSDAILEAWVDGVKVFGAYNFKYYNSGSRPQVTTLEMQHVYYNRSGNNQPTYMDNIVVANQYIGPVGDVSAAPSAPANVRILP